MSVLHHATIASILFLRSASFTCYDRQRSTVRVARSGSDTADRPRSALSRRARPHRSRLRRAYWDRRVQRR